MDAISNPFVDRETMLNLGNITKTMAAGGLALLLLPAPGLPGVALKLHAQDFPARLRRPPSMPPRITPPAVPPPQASPQVPAAPQAAAPEARQPGALSPAPPQALPPSLLQQPAKPAKIEFTADTLSIAAENSSLDEILHAISSKSGMLIQGLAQGLTGDERVFGNFGPGKPRDVLADLLNGTPYNIVMVGDLSSGAPRQLILSPLSPAAATASSAPSTPQSATGDDSDNPEPNLDSNPEPNIPGPTSSLPRQEIPPGFNPQAVKTPQQLFQELQAMRQQQQQQQQQQQEENAR